MIIPLWREGIVILLFAEWWKGRNKIQSPDSTVEKLFLSLFFSCMYILLLFSLLSLFLFFCIYCFYSHIFCNNVAQHCVFANAVRFRAVFFSREYRISPPPRVVSSGNWIPPMVISFGAIYIGFARVETPLSVHSSSPLPPSWQLYNEISRVGPLDRFLPRKRLIRLRRSGEKIVDRNDIPLSGRLLRAFTSLSSPSRGEGNVNDRKNWKERLNRDLVR